MNYKDLFNTVLSLISSPAKAWEEINLEDRRKVFTAFVYPMIGLCGLSFFLGTLFTIGWGGPQGFQVAMTRCCAVAVALFGGYYLAAYAINELYVRLFGGASDMQLAQQFAGYALVVTFVVWAVNGLLPDFAIVGWIFQFYIIYVVWEGVPVMLKIDEKRRFKFTILSSLLLLICPVLIEIIFNKLTMIIN